MNDKELIAQSIADKIQNGQVVGVGTGSTVTLAIPAIASKVRAENLTVRFISTSIQTTELLFSEGLDVLDFNYPEELDWGFDGADAVDPQGNLIKGKGGAMLIEKIMAVRCQQYYIIVDGTKIAADNVVTHCGIPVEVVPVARRGVQKSLRAFPGFNNLELRQASNKHGPVITEAGNLIVDPDLTKFSEDLESRLKSIPGVVETGLFIGYADQILTAQDGAVSVYFQR